MTIRHFKKGSEYRNYKCEGDTILATIEISKVWRSNPQVSELLAEGWEEYIQPAPKPYEPTREEKIQRDIREVYSASDEYMVLRHYSADPVTYADEFRLYNEFIESIIAKYPEENE